MNNCSFCCSQVLWKAYIDFEINLEEYDKTRDLYERLLKRTQHVKVVFFKLFFPKFYLCDFVESLVQEQIFPLCPFFVHDCF